MSSLIVSAVLKLEDDPLTTGERGEYSTRTERKPAQHTRLQYTRQGQSVETSKFCHEVSNDRITRTATLVGLIKHPFDALEMGRE